MEILKEGGIYSLTRILSLISYVFFVIITLYLVIKGQAWGNYDVFAAITAGGGLITQIGNKYCNSKYNTDQGARGKL